MAAASPVLGWTHFASAQPSPAGKPLRVGVLRTGSAKGPDAGIKIFVDAMRERGWVEGRTIVYDFAYGENDASRLPKVSAELVGRRPYLIYAQTGPEAVVALGHTRSIPIVFGAAVDPVEAGLVKSLAQPGGNVTGVATLGWELGGKRMQLLKDAMPKVSRVGVLTYSFSKGSREARNSAREQKLIEAAAGAGTKIIVATVTEADNFPEAFALLAEKHAEALVVCHNTQFFVKRKRILEHAAKRRIPVVGHRSELADDGALMTYSSNLSDQIRRAAQLVDKVLKGARPVDVPVEHPTQFEVVVNLKTARALGITLPQPLLLQANRVIE